MVAGAMTDYLCGLDLGGALALELLLERQEVGVALQRAVPPAGARWVSGEGTEGNGVAEGTVSLASRRAWPVCCGIHS